MTSLALVNPDPAEDVTLTLPWPPSVNTYWRQFNGRTILSRDGRQYRKDVTSLVHSPGRNTLRGRLAVTVLARPPDRRRRDLDNMLKAPLDALLHAKVYEDDGQIDYLVIERGEPCENGRLDITIREVAL